MNKNNIFYVFLYLVAIVAANLLIARFGPVLTIVNAFLFIGLDLTCRDKLHDAWYGRHLVLKMGILIAVGSILTYLFNRDAAQIALASFVAFAGAGIVDTIAYALLRERDWFVRVNGSNLFSAATDSILFPTLAFGSFMPLIVLGQFLSKVSGGLLWSLILGRSKKTELVYE